MRGLDAAFSLSPHVGRIKAAGLGFAGRYYSRNPGKDLSPPEAAALTEAGLLIVSVWEGRGDQYGSFTAPQGQADAEAALALARSCGQPEGSAIYFAVDFDASFEQMTHGIIPYFQAAGGVLHGLYRVGGYGSGAVLGRLFAAGLVSYLWLAQAKGWQGTEGFQGAHIIQGPETTVLLPGYAVDTDESGGGDFGGWSVGGAERPATPATAAAAAVPSEAEIAATLAALQRQLAARGYYQGAIDGIYGPQTAAALAAYERD